MIENALEKDASARFQSAAEFGRALLAASGLAAGHSSLLSLPSEELSMDDDEEPARTIHLVRKKAPSDGDRASLPNPPPSHRRMHVRVPYVTPVLLFSATGSEIKARSEEISEEGMLVLTPLAFPLGAPLKLRFASPVTGEMITMNVRLVLPCWI